jgi:hypothetical protein
LNSSCGKENARSGRTDVTLTTAAAWRPGAGHDGCALAATAPQQINWIQTIIIIIKLPN